MATQGLDRWSPFRLCRNTELGLQVSPAQQSHLRIPGYPLAPPPDPTDLPFLEVAAAGYADALITGNGKHFKRRRGRHDVEICTPGAFVERLG